MAGILDEFFNRMSGGGDGPMQIHPDSDGELRQPAGLLGRMPANDRMFDMGMSMTRTPGFGGGQGIPPSVMSILNTPTSGDPRLAARGGRAGGGFMDWGSAPTVTSPAAPLPRGLEAEPTGPGPGYTPDGMHYDRTAAAPDGTPGMAPGNYTGQHGGTSNAPAYGTDMAHGALVGGMGASPLTDRAFDPRFDPRSRYAR